MSSLYIMVSSLFYRKAGLLDQLELLISNDFKT